MSFKDYLPPGHSRAELVALQDATTLIQRFLKKSLENISYEALQLNSGGRHKLAEILAEFAYDLQNGIGLWLALERYNREFFDTPLPFVLKQKRKMSGPLINPDRLQYLLWYMYGAYKQDIIFSPVHNGFKELATQLTLFLNQHIRLKMKNSSVKKLLFSEDKYGWEVRQKLFWLGQHSYLFRDQYNAFVGKKKSEQGDSLIETFVSQTATEWSGLGVIDFLAGILDINESQRAELKGWYESHLSIYKILETGDAVQIAENLITNTKYTVHINKNIRKAATGNFVYGDLLPWNGEWYWSGEYYKVLKPDLPQERLEEIKAVLMDEPSIIYRYAKDLLQQALAFNEQYYNEFVEHFGDDLVVFSDGHKMETALKALDEKLIESMKPEAHIDEHEKDGMRKPWSHLKIPKKLLENDQGVGLYFEKQQGLQMMPYFDDVQSGLEKRGHYLENGEFVMLRGFITSSNVSPSFVKKAATGYKFRSIKEVFLLRDQNADLVKQFLFRRYKGHYFRNYYPNISMI